jgi:uncharacterized protein YndB with AHSA1/START domain
MSPATARTSAPKVEPVRASVEVPAPPAKAFEIFTRRMTDWWPTDYALVPTPRQVIVEPRKGGRWYEKGADGSERLVATVTAWDPPARVAFHWHIDAAWQSNPELATEVDVRFVPAGKGTRVELTHGGLERFGDAAAATREGLAGKGGWGDLLHGFAKAAGGK